MAAYERVTLNRGGRKSRFDCNFLIMFRPSSCTSLLITSQATNVTLVNIRDACK